MAFLSWLFRTTRSTSLSSSKVFCIQGALIRDIAAWAVSQTRLSGRYADRESGKRFATLAALLRLGTKYNVPYFREIAIRKLLAAFPVTLPVFDARRIEDHIADWHKYEYHTYAAISLSMECRVSAALPVLFCMLSPDVGRDTRGLLRQDALCARRGWGCNVLLNGKAASVEWM
jgi:hypothetical protein